MTRSLRTIILITLFAVLSLLLSIPLASAEVEAIDMLIDVEGYSLAADLYTYSEYVTMLGEVGVAPSDFILGEEPVAVILASYQKGDAYVWMEILEFASEGDASDEYALQAVDTEYISGLGYQGNNGPLYQRFTPRERVFVHGRFLFLFFYSPLDNMDAYGYMDDLLPTFVSHILETSGTSPPEPPGYTVDAVWGVEAGDVITWNIEDSTFTGSMGTGTSSSQGEWEGTLEVVDVRDGHLLVKQRSAITHIITEDETRVPVNIPYDRYTWLTPDEDGTSIEADDGSPSGAVIFPLELNGVPLVDLVYGSIDHLPERTITESEAYITVHGNTRSYSGFTPIETSWKDLTVHRGTGIVTSSDFYYNNNEYSITTSVGVTLESTSFQLSSRVPVVLSLAAQTSLSASSLTEGDTFTVTVRVTDQDGEAVSDAEVAGSFNSEDFSLTHQESGNYEATLSTEGLEAGTYGVIIDVGKAGYPSTTDSGSVSVQQRQVDPDDDSSGRTGIPGFPGLSIAIGATLATLAAARVKRRGPA
jgi:hypothetical protein